MARKFTGRNVTTYTVSMPEELHDKAVIQAREIGLSFSAWVTMILTAQIKEMEVKCYGATEP